MKIVYRFLFAFLLILLMQGCSELSSKETLTLEGESEHWKATVTLQLENYTEQPEYFKTRYFKGTVLQTKKNMKLDYISYKTAFNLNLGTSENNLRPSTTQKLTHKDYGKNQYSGGLSNYSIQEVKETLKFAEIEVLWAQDGIEYRELIIAKLPKN